MKPRIIMTVLSVVLVVFAGVVGYFWLTRAAGVFNPEDEVQAGNVAPDFSVQLLTGETFTLSEQIGTVVVLDFWATWCGPCVAKMPIMQALSEQFGESVTFVGVNVGEPQSRVQAFIDERGFTFPVGVDERGYIHRYLYPSPGIPYMVVINRQGLITATFLGGGQDMKALYEAAILDALR